MKKFIARRIVVDEFTDVDEEQCCAIMCSRSHRIKVFILGDSWQVPIFGFRGADSKVFVTLRYILIIIKLKLILQSYQKITDYATTVYKELRPLLGTPNLQISRIL